MDGPRITLRYIQAALIKSANDANYTKALHIFVGAASAANMLYIIASKSRLKPLLRYINDAW